MNADSCGSGSTMRRQEFGEVCVVVPGGRAGSGAHCPRWYSPRHPPAGQSKYKKYTATIQ